MRLQKYLALCGVASRRHAEEMIASGRVAVNGVTVTEMGTQVEESDAVEVDGRRVFPEAEKKYIIYHKPAGEVTTVSDPEGRPTVLDRFADVGVRLFPVGRLDYDSEGLLLLTNDGDLAVKMMHPSREVDKAYYCKVMGEIAPETIQRLSKGVMLDGHMTSPARVRLIRQEAFAATVMVTIHEGRNRQVRRMFEEVGHKVLLLRRVRFGPLDLGDLKRGEWRYLTENEVRELKNDMDRPAYRKGSVRWHTN